MLRAIAGGALADGEPARRGASLFRKSGAADRRLSSRRPERSDRAAGGAIARRIARRHRGGRESFRRQRRDRRRDCRARTRRRLRAAAGQRQQSHDRPRAGHRPAVRHDAGLRAHRARCALAAGAGGAGRTAGDERNATRRVCAPASGSIDLRFGRDAGPVRDRIAEDVCRRGHPSDSVQRKRAGAAGRRAGRVDLLVADAPAIAPHAPGTVRVIANAGQTRAHLFPDIPTMVEQGFDLVFESWQGLLAPRGTLAGNDSASCRPLCRRRLRRPSFAAAWNVSAQSRSTSRRRRSSLSCATSWKSTGAWSSA